MPLILVIDQLLRRAYKSGHMGVVPAGMHDACSHAARGRRHDFGREGQPGLFDHGKPVHIGAQQHGRPLAILHDGHDPGPAHAFGHLKAEIAHSLGQLGSGLMLFEAQFRVGVEIAVKLHQFGHVLSHPGAQILRRSRTGSDQRERCDPGEECSVQFHAPVPFACKSAR